MNLIFNQKKLKIIFLFLPNINKQGTRTLKFKLDIKSVEKLKKLILQNSTRDIIQKRVVAVNLVIHWYILYFVSLCKYLNYLCIFSI